MRGTSELRLAGGPESLAFMHRVFDPVVAWLDRVVSGAATRPGQAAGCGGTARARRRVSGLN